MPLYEFRVNIGLSADNEKEARSKLNELLDMIMFRGQTDLHISSYQTEKLIKNV